MLWIALVAMFTIAAIVMLIAIALAKDSSIDVGSVSSRWIAAHRVDAA